MTSTERALRTMRIQVQFELAAAAREVTIAVRRVEEADRNARSCTSRRERIMVALGRAMQRADFNPALSATLRREYDFAARAQATWDSHCAVERHKEAEARSVLAALRHRERGFARSIAAEQHKQALQRQCAEHLLIDELWLHRTTVGWSQ
jgi:hypothetical protein